MRSVKESVVYFELANTVSRIIIRRFIRQEEDLHETGFVKRI